MQDTFEFDPNLQDEKSEQLQYTEKKTILDPSQLTNKVES